MSRVLTATALFALVFSTFSTTVHADLIVVAGTTTTIDFDSTLAGSNNGAFVGGGLDAGATQAGRLDSNTWRVEGFSDGDSVFGGTHTSGDFARGTDPDAVGTGGLYGFDVSNTGGSSPNYAIGVQPAGSDFTPGNIALRLQNGSSAAIDSFTVDYDVFVFNDADRANSFNFEWSIDDATWNPVASADFTSPEAADGSPTWQSVSRSVNITGLNIAVGDNLYFRWVGDDVSGGGSRDQFGLDNINISVTAVPEPASLGLLAGAAGIFLLRRRRNNNQPVAEETTAA